jgi:hypothetical protein
MVAIADRSGPGWLCVTTVSRVAQFDHCADVLAGKATGVNGISKIADR